MPKTIKMMIKLIATSLFVLFSTFVLADAAEDQQAMGELKKIVPEVCSFSGEFTQSKQIKSLPVPLISKGGFVFSCDSNVKAEQPSYGKVKSFKMIGLFFLSFP